MAKTSIGYKISLWLNLILLIGLIGVFTYFQLKPPPEPVIIDNTETVVDTVWVPQVETELQVIHDTVLVDVPAQIPDHLLGMLPLQTYVRTYADSSLSARVESTVRGVLVQQRFFYTPYHFQIVQTTTTTHTIIQEKPVYIKRQFIQAGLETGLIGGKLQVNPMVGFTSQSGVTMFYRYSPWDKGHSIGVLSPIRFPKFKLPWL